MISFKIPKAAVKAAFFVTKFYVFLKFTEKNDRTFGGFICYVTTISLPYLIALGSRPSSANNRLPCGGVKPLSK